LTWVFFQSYGDTRLANSFQKEDDAMTQIMTPSETQQGMTNPQDVLRSVVRVDRSIRPTYPDWTKNVIHPELETTGPAMFYAGALEQYLVPGQVDGVVEGNFIYKHLTGGKMLEECLGLRDLEEIQKMDLDFFRKHFPGKAVFGWKSVVQSRLGDLNVPYLVENVGKVVLFWLWLDHRWDSNDPALHFGK